MYDLVRLMGLHFRAFYLFTFKKNKENTGTCPQEPTLENKKTLTLKKRSYKLYKS